MTIDQAKVQLGSWVDTEGNYSAELAPHCVLLLGSDGLGELSLEYTRAAASSDVDHWAKYGAPPPRLLLVGQEVSPKVASSLPAESQDNPPLAGHDVFLSYSSEDIEAVADLYDALTRTGYRIYERPGASGMSIFVDLRAAEDAASGELFTDSWGKVEVLWAKVVEARADFEHVAYHDVYQARILDLREIAEDDEDIEEVNEDSITDFWVFIETMEFTRRAGLVLQDNGNLRAVWRDKEGHNVGLEFQGSGSVLYVMFKPYTDGRKTFREAGVAPFSVVVDRLRELDLLSFVSA